MGRPLPSFNDFIGHRRIIEGLKRLLDGAMQRQEPFPHSVFVGPSGVGKTKLAAALSAEYGTKCIVRYGDICLSKLTATFLQLQRCDFLFVDEAHNLSPACQELLYRVIDDNVVPQLDAEHAVAHAESHNETVAVEPCTIILSTDRPGILRQATQRRFGHRIQLEYYSSVEMKEIVEKVCSELNLLISPQAARMIAEISRGLPGFAKHHIAMLRCRHPDAEKNQLGKTEVEAYCEAQAIDEIGLLRRDRQYLSFLRKVSRASLESIALKLGTDCADVRRNIEPYLTHMDLVQIARGGRCLTEKGRNLVQTWDRGSNESK